MVIQCEENLIVWAEIANAGKDVASIPGRTSHFFQRPVKEARKDANILPETISYLNYIIIAV